MAPSPSLAFLSAVAIVSLGCADELVRDTRDDKCPAESPSLAAGAADHALKTVFVIVLENRDWSAIAGNPSAPYINGVLLPSFAHAENYWNGGLHTSLGNYIALVAGSPLGIFNDPVPSPPTQWPLPVTCHLATYLEATGLSWKEYAEGIDGTYCPTLDVGLYAVRHNPFVYFEDVSGSPPGPLATRCVEHVRPYSELARDLQWGNVARYNFISPNICNDGHDRCRPLNDPVRQADAWLARELPTIMASKAYRSGGVIFITWDEGAEDHEAPIGLIAVSPFAKPGFASSTRFSYASTVRTVQEILGVTPLLRNAASATSLAEFFTRYP